MAKTADRVEHRGPSPKQIGRQLRQVRKQQGLSRSDVARSAGLTRRELAAYEHGRVQVPDSDLWCLAGSCGVDVTELLPEREPLKVGTDLSALSVGDSMKYLRGPAEPDGLLHEYLSMIYELRNLPQGSRVPLREPDLIALAEALGGTPETIERRLRELIGATDEEASRLRAMILPPLSLPSPGPALEADPIADFTARDAAANDFFSTPRAADPFQSPIAPADPAFSGASPVGDPYDALPRPPADSSVVDLPPPDAMGAVNLPPPPAAAGAFDLAPPDASGAVALPPPDATAAVDLPPPDSWAAPDTSIPDPFATAAAGAPAPEPVLRSDPFAPSSEPLDVVPSDVSVPESGGATPLWTPPADPTVETPYVVDQPYTTDQPFASGPALPTEPGYGTDQPVAAEQTFSEPSAFVREPSAGFEVFDNLDLTTPDASAPAMNLGEWPGLGDGSDDATVFEPLVVDVPDLIEQTSSELAYRAPDAAGDGGGRGTPDSHPYEPPENLYTPETTYASHLPSTADPTYPDQPSFAQPAYAAQTAYASPVVQQHAPLPSVDDTQPAPVTPDGYQQAGPDWRIGGTAATAPQGGGGLALRRADTRWALADLVAPGDFTLETVFDFRSGSGFGVLFHASVDDAERLTSYSLDFDMIAGNGGFVLRQWEIGTEHWQPLAQVPAAESSRLYGRHVLTLGVHGDRLTVALDGDSIVDVDGLSRCSLDHGRAPCRGDRVGIQAAATTEVTIESFRLTRH